MQTIYSALIPNAAESDRDKIAKILAGYPTAALTLAIQRGISVRPLGEHESYRDVSPALRCLAIDVDAWPAPPAGLFVVEERRVYLRSLSPMTVAHEFAHALDCALGDGTYWSSRDPAIRRAYSTARAFVTPYAASGLDEYFAESVRAYVEINDACSPWPVADRRRLRALDPAIYGIVRRLLSELW